MGIVGVWQNIFKYVFYLATFSFMIMSFIEGLSKEKKENSVTTKQKDEGQLYDIIQFFIVIIAIVIYIIGCVYIAVNQKLIWLLSIFVVLEVLDKLAGTFVSIGVVRDVVKENTKGTLSEGEYKAFFLISFVMIVLQIANCFNYLIDCARKHFDSITSDLLVLLLYVITLCIYIFLTCAQVTILISFVTKMVKQIDKYIPGKDKIKRCGDFFAERTNKSIKQSQVTVLLIKRVIKRNVFVRIICIPVAAVTVALDIGAFVFHFIFSLMIAVVGYIVIIYRMISGAIKKVIRYIIDLSGKKIVAVSFRVAIIAALVIAVIANRYDAFVEEIDNSTAVLEFVASSIVIPVVFEWIHSSSNKARAVK